MKILVTGGSGFIGTELAKALTLLGHEVTVADIKPPRLNVPYIFCDVTDGYQVYKAIEDKDLTFHLAANPDPSLAEKNPHWDLRINCEGTLNVIEACKEHNSKMIFSSTAAINYSPLSYYAISKRTAEKYILKNIKTGLDAIILRYNNVYGPTQGPGYVIPDLIQKLTENPKHVKIRGTGLDMRDFVYINDVINATILAAEKGATGAIYEVGTGRQVTIIELTKLIGKIINKIEPEVEPAIKSTTATAIKFPQFLEPLRDLGWTPKYTLEEGIKKIVSEMKRRYDRSVCPACLHKEG